MNTSFAVQLHWENPISVTLLNPIFNIHVRCSANERRFENSASPSLGKDVSYTGEEEYFYQI